MDCLFFLLSASSLGGNVGSASSSQITSQLSQVNITVDTKLISAQAYCMPMEIILWKNKLLFERFITEYFFPFFFCGAVWTKHG